METKKPRRALVTGASGGIGRAICTALAAGGYDVAVHYATDEAGAHESAAAVEAAGRRAAIVQADCEDAEAIGGAIDEATSALEGIDCLVANHAVVDFGYIRDLSLEQWRRTIDINMTGTFLLVRGCLGQMIERGWGRIIATTGSLAHHGGEGFSHLSASKAGIELLVKSAAFEAGPHAVTANLVSPGPTNTRLLADVPEDFMEKKFAELPLGRFAEPNDIAAAVAFLASEEARSVTGQTLRVNCGDVMYG